MERARKGRWRGEEDKQKEKGAREERPGGRRELGGRRQTDWERQSEAGHAGGVRRGREEAWPSASITAMARRCQLRYGQTMVPHPQDVGTAKCARNSNELWDLRLCRHHWGAP